MTDLNLNGLTDAQLRLFAVRCVRRVQHLLTDPRSVAVLDVAERHALGRATDKELAAARDAAWASHAAASAALWATTSATASAAVRAAGEARDAEREAQAKILDQIRQETKR